MDNILKQAQGALGGAGGQQQQGGEQQQGGGGGCEYFSLCSATSFTLPPSLHLLTVVRTVCPTDDSLRCSAAPAGSWSS